MKCVQRIVSNFSLKWDNAPAAYGAFFGFCAYCAQVDFAVGRYPLALVVRLIILGVNYV